MFLISPTVLFAFTSLGRFGGDATGFFIGLAAGMVICIIAALVVVDVFGHYELAEKTGHRV